MQTTDTTRAKLKLELQVLQIQGDILRLLGYTHDSLVYAQSVCDDLRIKVGLESSFSAVISGESIRRFSE